MVEDLELFRALVLDFHFNAMLVGYRLVAALKLLAVVFGCWFLGH